MTDENTNNPKPKRTRKARPKLDPNIAEFLADSNDGNEVADFINGWDHDRIEHMTLDEAKIVAQIKSQKIVFGGSYNVTGDPTEAMRVAAGMAKRVMEAVLNTFYAVHIANKKLREAAKLDKETEAADANRVVKAETVDALAALGIPAAATEGPQRT